MSDMIDRIDEIAAQAGADVAEQLSDHDVTARLAARVRRDVRRRRTTTAALATVVAAMATVAAVVVPHLLQPTQIPPASPAREPVETSDGLIAYSDGSMQVLTQHGEVVEVPAAAADAPTFHTQGATEACRTDAKYLVQGWTPQFTGAFNLVGYARPLLATGAGTRVLAPGQTVTLPALEPFALFTVSVDVDPAIAAHVVMTVNAYALAPNGRVGYYVSSLESRPAVDYSGSKSSGTYTATLTTRPLATFQECAGESHNVSLATASGVPIYVSATVFLSDGHGHLAPIGTYNSWVTIAKESE